MLDKLKFVLLYPFFILATIIESLLKIVFSLAVLVGTFPILALIILAILAIATSNWTALASLGLLTLAIFFALFVLAFIVNLAENFKKTIFELMYGYNESSALAE